ncbi:MAG: immunoglobulin domain-containing protein, partial [Verrucomicrobia bacterium]|nr:immunoglobulin domain-containing protein [Verrucomicrobiota bacterium]
RNVSFVEREETSDPGGIAVPPQSQTVLAGANVTFTVTATGTLPLNYQWRKDGVNLAGANNATLTLNSVGASASGGYSVVLWNAYGSAVSAIAHLAVLADGANGTQPTQLSEPPAPAMDPGQDSLVLVTHGWQFSAGWSTSRPQWMADLCAALQSKVPANWVVWPYDWLDAASKPTPDTPLSDARLIVGPRLGERLAAMHLSQLHLISHSAGAGLIEAAANKVRALGQSPIIHCTFLDPFTGAALEGRSYYGQSANWADNYFVHDFLTDVLPTLDLVRQPGETEGPLDYAYNVDVAAAAPGALSLPVFFSGPNATAGSTPAIGSYSPSHGSPHEFYLSTVLGTAPACPEAAGYGFAFSQEAGGWASRLTHPVHNNPPFALCGSRSPIQNAAPLVIGFTLPLESLPNATSASGVTLFSGGGASLSATAANHGGVHPKDVGTPAWLAVGVTITNNVNFVQFEAGFTDTNAAQGLLTVYWNTNQIGMLDERVALAGLQTYRFVLPATVSEGLYTLSFRLDVFTNASSIAITNVATGFVGISQPIRLDMLSVGSNNAPIVKLTAAPGYNYLMQSSTNLVNWIPTALLVNTNGTVLFADPAVTNSTARFYRAVMP